MSATKALPQFEAFAPHVDPFGASQAAMSFWLQRWRASMDVALWWSECWFLTLSAFTPAAAAPAAAPSARPVADLIDLAEVAASRTAAEVADVVATTVEIAEIMADASVAVAEDAASVAVHAAAVAADTPDDLTRLVGIGPKLSAALAERGVVRFAQLAAWTETELSEIDRALDLKGRAVRDAWVAQAKRLAAEA